MLFRLVLVAAILGTWTPAFGQAPKAEAPIVEYMAVEGNHVLSTGQIRLLMTTRPSPWYTFLPGVKPRRLNLPVLENDLVRIRTRYRSLGYYDAVVDSSIQRVSKHGVEVLVRIQEGEPVRVSRVVVHGLPKDPAVDSLRIRKALQTRPGKPLDREDLDADRTRIANRLYNTGYAFAVVAERVTVDPESLKAAVTFRLTPGPKCTVDTVKVVGNHKVSTGVIRRGLAVRKGDVYRKRQLILSQRLLYQTGAFRSVSLGVPDSVAQESPVPVVVSVSEQPPRTLKLGAGYDTEERLRGSISWLHRNFLGGARQLSVEGAASAIEDQVTASLRQPYILGNRTWLYLSGYVDRKLPLAVRVKKFGGSASVEWSLRSTKKLVFQVQTDLVDFRRDSTQTNFLIQYQEDTRDDFFNPQRGMLALLSVQESGLLFHSGGQFLKLTGEGRWYRRIFWHTVLAFRIHGGAIQELGSTREIPNFERFFAGGASSVRGWSLNQLGPRDAAGNPVGGQSLLEGSLELRTRLTSFLGTAVFMDAGNVGLGKLDAFTLSGFGVSAGAGLRYLSPIGPLRIDVAYRLTEDRFVPERRIYFSLGQAF